MVLLLLLLVLPDEPLLALAVGSGTVVEMQPGEGAIRRGTCKCYETARVTA